MAFKELAQRRNLWFKIFLGLTAAELQGNIKKKKKGGKKRKKTKALTICTLTSYLNSEKKYIWKVEYFQH